MIKVTVNVRIVFYNRRDRDNFFTCLKNVKKLSNFGPAFVSAECCYKKITLF